MIKYRKKTMATLLIAIFMISIFSVAIPVSAQPTEVWVDDDGPVELDTIQEGIDAVAVGGTVYVAAGIYSSSTNGESFPLTIDKSLTLKGAQFGVNPTFGARTEETEESVIDATDAECSAIEILVNDVFFDGFTVTNVHWEPTDESPGAKYGIKVMPQSEDHTTYSNGITIQNNILTDNSRGIYLLDNENSLVRKNLITKCGSINTGLYGWYHGGTGIALMYVRPTTVVTENLLTENTARVSYYGPIMVSAASGAFVPGGEITQPTITNNEIINNYFESPTSLTAGITLIGASAIIRGNTISGNEGVGIWATDFYAIPPENPILIEDNTIIENGLQGILLHHELVVSVTGNTIADNGGAGISISGQPTDVNIHYNNILGNGLGVSAVVPTNAENNWWGDPSGPYHLTTNPEGLGDEVSDNVDYDPWLHARVRAMDSFVIEHAKIDFKKKINDDKVNIKGHYELDLETGDGVNIEDEITLTISDENGEVFSQTILMVEKGKGEKWEYKRPKAETGGIKHMTIHWKDKGLGKFDVKIDNEDMDGIINPVTIKLEIGDDVGEEIITMREHKHHWDYKAKHADF